MVAERDTIVPARFGRHLYEQLRSPKRLWQVPGAGHNDWLDHVDERWWAEVADYLLHSPLARGDTASANGKRP